MSPNERPDKSGSPETRRFARYALDVRLAVHVFRAGAVSYFWGRSTEIGADGIGATLTGDLDPGEVVSMEFPLPLAAYPLKLRAAVRHRDGLHYGFEFLTLTEDQHKILERVCQMLASGASPNSAPD